MTRKCLIALAVIALSFGSIAQAHPMWQYGVTTVIIYDWAKKTQTVDVYIKVVRWAQIYTRYAVVMTQQTDGTFCGCTWVQVCVNFPNLRIDASLALDETDSQEDLADKWHLALGYFGDTGPRDPDMENAPDLPSCVAQQYTQVIGPGAITDKATMLLAGPHLTGSLAYVALCVKAEGVDPQAMQFLDNDVDKANIRKIGTVTLTYYPNDPPTDSDWGTSITGIDAIPADLGDDPWNPNGPAPNGDGSDHGIPAGA